MTLILPEFDLSRFNTLAVPAKAMAYTSVHSQEELIEALCAAEEHGWPILPLGGGSNIVLANDFQGLVVHLKLQGIELVDENDDCVWVRAQAGENWHEFVRHTLQYGWYGLENLALIPGSVGAAPIQNIGAYGVELEALFEELTAIEVGSKLPVTFTRDSCAFGYRDSVFKQHLRDKYIICDVLFKLKKIPAPVLTYPALSERVEAAGTTISPKIIFDTVCQLRREKLPDPEQVPNVGSFFKNPVISNGQYLELQKSNPNIVGYPQQESGVVKLAAAWLIDQAGFKGQSLGTAAVHDKQALVLTNPGRGSALDVMNLAQTIQQEVYDLFGVPLEMEPRVYD